MNPPRGDRILRLSSGLALSQLDPCSLKSSKKHLCEFLCCVLAPEGQHGTGCGWSFAGPHNRVTLSVTSPLAPSASPFAFLPSSPAVLPLHLSACIAKLTRRDLRLSTRVPALLFASSPVPAFLGLEPAVGSALLAALPAGNLALNASPLGAVFATGEETVRVSNKVLPSTRFAAMSLRLAIPLCLLFSVRAAWAPGLGVCGGWSCCVNGQGQITANQYTPLTFPSYTTSCRGDVVRRRRSSEGSPEAM